MSKKEGLSKEFFERAGKRGSVIGLEESLKDVVRIDWGLDADIPTSTSKKGIINSVRKYKEEKGNKNDCWNIALSLATNMDYYLVRAKISEMNGIDDDNCMYSGCGVRFFHYNGFYTRGIQIDVKMSVKEFVLNSDSDKQYIIWCKNNNLDERKIYSHLIYSTNNEIWDDKKTRLDWEVDYVYEIKSIKEDEL